MAEGSAPALSLSRPAQASLTLRPARSLSRPRRPLSRGSGPAGYPAKPLVSYQINRQLSGWNLPPLMIRAFGAHGQKATYAVRQKTFLFDHLVGDDEQRWRNGEAKRFGSLEIDRQLEFGRLLDRDIAGFRPVQNLVDQLGRASE